MKRVFISLIVIVFLVSCKDEKIKEESSIEKVNEDTNDRMKVTLNVTVKKDDSFQIFYKDNEADNFEEKKSFFVEFKGNDQPQEIVFLLPEDVLPNYLRLDFGTNKNQTDMIINNFRINYYDKSFEAKGNEFFNYFYPNELVKIEAQESKVTPIVSQNGNYDPVFCSAEGLKIQLELLIK
ncbi:hypothetical protein [Flavobacterium capsici]|uniref:Lipoprotein n=1 Tax=Flavobacterium capsici TaxID=3075618 RepID=A0AA96J3T6_9FLAO|nr:MULTISPECIES: hypothetical protein [unclassified Flavobacterium]WNM19668.1 hypothetical protein RN608_03040 [Flavobacterium sp. PMR2A8]WNM21057.1 hypothetical protein RN605_10210 [Flavobacterium sp. PMTSA4]